MKISIVQSEKMQPITCYDIKGRRVKIPFTQSYPDVKRVYVLGGLGRSQEFKLAGGSIQSDAYSYRIVRGQIGSAFEGSAIQVACVASRDPLGR